MPAPRCALRCPVTCPGAETRHGLPCQACKAEAHVHGMPSCMGRDGCTCMVMSSLAATCAASACCHSALPRRCCPPRPRRPSTSLWCPTSMCTSSCRWAAATPVPVPCPPPAWYWAQGEEGCPVPGRAWFAASGAGACVGATVAALKHARQPAITCTSWAFDVCPTSLPPLCPLPPLPPSSTWWSGPSTCATPAASCGIACSSSARTRWAGRKL